MYVCVCVCPPIKHYIRVCLCMTRIIVVMALSSFYDGRLHRKRYCFRGVLCIFFSPALWYFAVCFPRLIDPVLRDFRGIFIDYLGLHIK